MSPLRGHVARLIEVVGAQQRIPGMKMQAAVLEQFGVPMPVHQINLQAPPPVKCSSAQLRPFCSTDWLGWKAMRNKKLPVILGHTAVGIVEKLEPTSPASNWAISRVSLNTAVQGMFLLRDRQAGSMQFPV